MITKNLKWWLALGASIIVGFWAFAFLRPDFIFYAVPKKGAADMLAATNWSVCVAASLLVAGAMLSIVIVNNHRDADKHSWRPWVVLATIILSIAIGGVILVVSDSGIQKRGNELCAGSPSYPDIAFLDFRAQYCDQLKNPH